MPALHPPALLEVVQSDPLLVTTGPVDAELAALFGDELERWSDVEPSTKRPVGDLAAFVLAGGKRLRPAFVHWGFVGAGGDPAEPDVARLGAAMELLHAFALLHDDVMDGAATRRGRAAEHVRLGVEHRSRGWHGESRRFGEGLAILLGDLAFVYADRLLPRVDAVRAIWDEMRIELTVGQYLDVTGAAYGEHDLERAELVALYKSGRYSVERPLQLGAALAGRSVELAPYLQRFGAPLGEAFQLRDDLLGVFGDAITTGKPVGDDLREGKPTVLLAYAHALATPRQRHQLDRVGAPDLTPDEIAELQGLFVRCGAVDAVEGAIAVRVQAALSVLSTAPLTAQAREALSGLAHRLAWREL